MNKPHTPSIELVYFDFGGGHRSAATALKDVMADQYPHWKVKLVNLQDILKPMDIVQKFTGVKSEDVYNKMLKHGMTYGSATMLRGVQQVIRLNGSKIEKLLEGHWEKGAPDLVVSLIPNFNRPMFRALRHVAPQTPYVTVMTDLVDRPPHFWQERQDQYIIGGTDTAIKQAEKMGYAPGKIFAASGMILKPGFYTPQTSDREAERERLGLDPKLPTAMIMFGGFGTNAAARIVQTFKRSNMPVQSIVMCGHNEALRESLQGVKGCHAVGFTKDVPYYMHLSDCMIGKPGPGSISEALHLGLPVIVERNLRTLPQERPNADWVAANQFGIVVKSFHHIGLATKKMLTGDTLERFRANAAALNNRAVFEIPQIFEQIMANHDATATPQAPAQPKKIAANRRRLSLLRRRDVG